MNVGEIYMFAGITPPAGFLICDGSSISRSIYSDLFDVIGVSYGHGDGSTTFNIPELQGRVIVGASINHALAETGGEEFHTLTLSEIPAHSHDIPSHGHSSTIKATTPALNHSITQPTFTYMAPGTTDNRTSSGKSGFNGTTSTNATRSANLAISNHTAAACTKTGGVSNCASFDSSSTGSGNGHNNMQPYTALNYIIYTGVTA